YDRGWAFAPRPRAVRPDPLDMPSARMFVYDAIYARNLRSGEGWLIAQPGAAAARRLDRLEAAVSSASRVPSPASGGLVAPLSPGLSRAVHLSRIESALDLIRDGEIYQVNLTYPLVGRYAGDPRAAFFRVLRRAPPFAAFLRVSAEATII